MTTVASVWTNAQFLDGSMIKGLPLACVLRQVMCLTLLTSKTVAGGLLSRTR